MPRRVNPEVAHQKARVAGLTRAAADPARITEARAQLAEANARARVREIVAAWPPLPAEVKAQLAVILLGGSPQDPAA